MPQSRLPELHFYIRAVTDRDILALRRQGRILWEKYFGSIQSIVDSIIGIISILHFKIQPNNLMRISFLKAVYRHRLGVPPTAITDEPSPSVFNQSFTVFCLFFIFLLTQLFFFLFNNVFANLFSH